MDSTSELHSSKAELEQPHVQTHLTPDQLKQGLADHDRVGDGPHARGKIRRRELEIKRPVHSAHQQRTQHARTEHK